MLGILCLMFVLVSCDKDSVSGQAKSSKRITLQDALSNLEVVLSEIDGNCSKSLSHRQVLNVGFYCNDTKSSVGDTLLYLVNFENDRGYAILSAVDYLSPILAIVDTGSIDMGALRHASLFPNKLIRFYSGTMPGDGDDNEDIFNPWDRDPGGPSYNWGPVAPLLRSKWGQGAPFNNAFDVDPETGERYLPGCTAIAAAQILAYSQDVSLRDEYGIETSTWDDFCRCPNDTSAIRDTDISIFIRRVSEEINAIYDIFGTGETFAWPLSAKRYFQRLGYENAKRYIFYNEQEIIKSLNSRKPVLIGALDEAIEEGGHSWVIDGKYSTVMRVNDAPVQSLLLHCNWGWRGLCDGYYVSEAFNLASGMVSNDPSIGDVSGSSNSNFNWMFRVVTY